MSLQINVSWHLSWLTVALAVGAAPLTASAQERQLERRVPSSPNELRLSFAPVVQRAADCFEEASRSGWGQRDGAAIAVFWSTKKK